MDHPPQIKQAFKTLREDTAPAWDEFYKGMAAARAESARVLKETGSQMKSLKAFDKACAQVRKAFSKAIEPAIERFNTNPDVRVYDALTCNMLSTKTEEA